MQKRVLIIGGTGVFGQKLCHHIAKNFDLDLIISSRSENNAINWVHKLKRFYPYSNCHYHFIQLNGYISESEYFPAQL